MNKNMLCKGKEKTYLNLNKRINVQQRLISIRLFILVVLGGRMAI